MDKPNWLITVASWEERFLLGTQRLLSGLPIQRVLMFFYSEYASWTEENRLKVLATCEERSLDCQELEISFGDPAMSWQKVHEQTFTSDDESGVPIVDITTMPRDTLWSTLWLLKTSQGRVQYAYHRPGSYSPEWLSRDPGRPRLVYKLSGIATLGRPTCLIITTGFDPERTRQLMWFYEPRQICLGFQTGEQYHNQDLNVERHRSALKDEYREFDVQEFWVDAYGPDHGEAAVTEKVMAERDAHNVVMSSLGPKLGAVALLRVHLAHPETALSYTPSSEYNSEYSKRLGETVTGML